MDRRDVVRQASDIVDRLVTSTVAALVVAGFRLTPSAIERMRLSARVAVLEAVGLGERFARWHRGMPPPIPRESTAEELADTRPIRKTKPPPKA